ncbi:nucleoside hydrolase [Alphaproteobacteria bacterium]|nr:nucleoside hydrolase [Alphaproteobacteria bacterium]
MTQKIIIDTDPGIDDAMAIHMAFADDRLDVIGLTTIFGNVTTAIATRNALRLGEMAHYPTDVAAGEPVPLARAPQPPADFVHGGEGFGDVPAAPAIGSAIASSAAEYLCAQCAAHPGEIIICAVGPLTNLAAALAHDPMIAKNAKSVVIMGGSAAYHGNVTPCAEANIWNDPDAADAVFAADWQVTMVGLDVTEKTQCTPADFDILAAKAPKIGGFLRDAAAFYFDFHEQKTGVRSCFMHDPSAVLAITDPAMFEIEDMPLEVVCTGDEIGRTKRFDGTGRRNVHVAMGVNSVAAREKFIALVSIADSMTDKRMID